MGIWLLQTNFNRGELDPVLAGRTDIAAYYNGMQTAKNVLTIPQGGVKRRPGMEFLGEALSDGRMEVFSFSVALNYLLVFTDLRMQVYKNDVLQTNINGSGNDYLVTPWTGAQAKEFDYIQSLDTAIITHEDIEVQTITRTSDTDWAIAAAPLLNIFQFNFNDGLSPTPVSEIQTLRFNGYLNGDTFKIGLEGIITDEISYNIADTADLSQQITDALQRLPNTGVSGISTVFVSGTTWEITFSGSSAADWALMTTTIISSPAPTNNTTTATETQAGTTQEEDVWSNTRGWPRTCTFHEGRLWFGGSTSRPSTIWGSNVNQFFNFRVGKARDDESISATLDTDQLNIIQAVFSNRSLQIFTSGAEFYIRESPITPSNIAVIPQTNLGSRRIRPVSMDGVTLYAQRTGRVINAFVFINEFQANQTNSVSTLAAHLINNPVKLVTSKGSSRTDANYVYILNETGLLTVFNTLASEDIEAFTRWESGLIRSVAVVSDKLYMLVEREVQEQTVFYVEVESSAILMDSAISTNVGGSDTLTGLGHLEGETVDVKADGAYMGTEVVTGGMITISRDAEVIEAGLPYSPLIKTMPLNIGLNSGPNAMSKKKILRAAIHLFESNGVLINGQRLADRTMGIDQFDPPIPQTGLKRITLLGWSLEAFLTVTQDTPFPMTILSLGNEVKT